MGGFLVNVKVVAQFRVGQFRFTIVSSYRFGGIIDALRNTGARFDS